eukprot:CAMPEP_0197297854 /NCGR_PEP_ID=MMETSP0890-20130614/42155_1 /TAXON_ID=44058 ORGANISM="Aureoumbra lagunensis, Strain CCMP1510" /NCGR_SAMPLE_ID=MMETSP0890 /ASSEMBLY_ACC=CAM_ASM_000533 /LENGTH=224 /DNA_ID=CAMNT_0042775241 /DNA_START=127 /DNA_END=801 /DNA_ORIENTATION=-
MISRAFSSSPPPVSPTPEEKAAEEKKVLAAMEAEKEKRQLNVTPQHIREVAIPPCPQAEVITDVNTIGAQPKHHRERTVMIGQRGKHANTSAWADTKAWHITWTCQERWANPMMGWTSTADPMTQLDMRFDTKEQAIAFAEKNGWKYTLKEPVRRKDFAGYSTYSDNFLPPGHANEIKAYGQKTKIFKHPTANQSHYFRPLKYHGDGQARQHGPNFDNKEEETA